MFRGGYLRRVVSRQRAATRRSHPPHHRVHFFLRVFASCYRRRSKVDQIAGVTWRDLDHLFVAVAGSLSIHHIACVCVCGLCMCVRVRVCVFSAPLCWDPGLTGAAKP